MDRPFPSHRLRWRDLIVLAGTLIIVACLLIWVQPQRFLQPQFRPDPALDVALRSLTAYFRQIIVLMDGADTLDEAARARCLSAGRQIFWRKQQTLEQIRQKLT